MVNEVGSERDARFFWFKLLLFFSRKLCSTSGFFLSGRVSFLCFGNFHHMAIFPLSVFQKLSVYFHLPCHWCPFTCLLF